MAKRFGDRGDERDMIEPTGRGRRAFQREMERAEEELNLARAALLIAREEYPQLPLEQYLVRLEILAEEVLDRLDGETAAPVVLSEVVRHLFGVRKMRGNRDHYHDPRNSYLNDVLDRDLGIPLTLAIIVLEVGWRLGLDVEGVNFPGHFLVRYRGEARSFLIDPFHGGAIRSRSELQKVLRGRGTGTTPVSEPLRSASKHDVIVRLLLNLKAAHYRARDHERALAAVERILIVRPTAQGQIRDRGYLLARLGRAEEAVGQLETYLALAPRAGDLDRVEALLRELRADGRPLPGQP